MIIPLHETNHSRIQNFLEDERAQRRMATSGVSPFFDDAEQESIHAQDQKDFEAIQATVLARFSERMPWKPYEFAEWATSRTIERLMPDHAPTSGGFTV